jgi:hypothetical protein
VAGSCEYGDEPSGSGATEEVILRKLAISIVRMQWASRSNRSITIHYNTIRVLWQRTGRVRMASVD